jgi:hypothetical protein
MLASVLTHPNFFFLLLLCVTEIPVFPTVTAKVTFQEFHWVPNQPADLFVIPDGYREDPMHFPDL